MLELAEWQGEVKLAKELLELESSLISLEGRFWVGSFFADLDMFIE